MQAKANATLDQPVDAVACFAEAVLGADDLADLERVYLDRVRDFLPFRAAGFYLFDRAGGVEHIATSGVSEYFLTRYERVGRTDDPVLAAVTRSLRPAHAAGMMQLHEWRASDIYRDVFYLHRMNVLLEAPLLSGGRMIGSLNFADSERRQPTGQELLLAGAFGRILGAALRGIRERTRIDRGREHALSALEISDDALVLTDLSSGDRHVNAAGERLLAELAPADATRCVDELLATWRSAEPAPVSMPVSLLGGRSAELVMDSHLAADSTLIVSSLRLRHPDRRPPLPAGIAAGLTEREREAVQLVLCGLRNAEIALEMVISTHTVKQYLKSAYRKLGVGSRSQLGALVREHSVVR